MFSDHAPNRNPAEISFAAVDRRLSATQRDEVLAIAECYGLSAYLYDYDTREAIVYDNYFSNTVVVTRNGKALPQ